MFNPLFIGKVLHDFENLPSTNEYAIELLSKSKPSEGTAISTYNQTRGRGQIGSKWESQAGRNLSISVILYPNFLKAQEQSLLNQCIAIACRSFLDKYLAAEVALKWPNDLMVKRKKIGGILIQNALSGSQIQSSVIGIGVNINQRQFSAAPNPTSLALLNNQFYELNELRSALFAEIEQQYLRLKAGRFQEIKADYLRHLYRLGEKCLFERNNQELFRGTIVGITPVGQLLIETNSGQEAFGIKEIQLKE